MNNQKPKCITFAGPGGIGKTQVANYLSHSLNLPIFSNNAIRLEETENLLDYGKIDQTYLEKRNARFQKLLDKKINFIYAASVDRRFDDFKKLLEQAGYEYLVISFDVSDQFLKKILKSKDYHTGKDIIDPWISDHQDFVKNHGAEISLNITDTNYSDRMALSLETAEKFLKS